jgi:hypothetical protein
MVLNYALSGSWGPQGCDLAQVRMRRTVSEPQSNIEPFAALHLDPDQF